MWKVLEIVLLIVVPLAWGLGTEYVFELRRRRKSTGPARQDEAAP